MEHGATARATWLATETQFLGNQETWTLYLDAQFCNFVQGDLSITEYCQHFKTMANALIDLGEFISDRTLVLNILRGLNDKYSSVGLHLRCGRPFPTFLEVRSDLLMEELTHSNTSHGFCHFLQDRPSTASFPGTWSSSPVTDPG
jgi:hypothetical protein